MNLLPRFYDLKEGEILIDGTNINRFTLQSLRRQIGIVQQDVFLFNGTIRENVLYGRLDATDEEVDRAIEQAKLKEVIEDLEDGVDTHIGERGVKLSGGQKQRTLNCSYFLEESFYFNLGRSNELRSIHKPRSLFNNRLTSWQKVERPLLLLTVCYN